MSLSSDYPQVTPQPFDVATAQPLAAFSAQEVLPDPASPGVTWYEDWAGNLIPGAGTFYDIVALNIDSVITVADNIDDLILAVNAAANAANSATQAAGSATAAGASAQLSADSATMAGNASTIAQNMASTATNNANAAGVSAAQAATSATNAGTSATNAASSATSASSSATQAYNAWFQFHGTWYGAAAAPPALDPWGNPPTAGDVYFDTTMQALQVWNGAAWVDLSTASLTPSQVWNALAAYTGAFNFPHALLINNDPVLTSGIANQTFLQLAGGTLTGPVTLAGDATQNLQPVTYQQLMANAGAVIVSDTPPAGARDGSLWYDSAGTQTYLRFNDGTSTQWVPASNYNGPFAEASIDGGLYARQNGTWADVRTNTSVQNNVGRNLIHNPLFNIQQRGAGPWTTSGYTVDRWQVGVTGSDTVSATPFVIMDAGRAAIGDEAAVNGMHFFVTGSAVTGSNTSFGQTIENVRRLAGKTVTLSFWATVSAGTTPIALAINQNWGNGGSPSAMTQTDVGVIATLTTTWTRYSFTLTVPSSAGKTLGTNNNDNTSFWIGLSKGVNTTPWAGLPTQSGTFSFWGIQLEIGSVATPLEKPDPQQDLAKCQRFYQVGYGNHQGYATASIVVAHSLPLVPMRATPTMQFNFAGSSNVTSGTVGAQGSTAVPSATVAATGQFVLLCSFSASADL